MGVIFSSVKKKKISLLPFIHTWEIGKAPGNPGHPSALHICAQHSHSREATEKEPKQTSFHPS